MVPVQVCTRSVTTSCIAKRICMSWWVLDVCMTTKVKLGGKVGHHLLQLILALHVQKFAKKQGSTAWQQGTGCCDLDLGTSVLTPQLFG